jgi:hypothetical protein
VTTGGTFSIGSRDELKERVRARHRSHRLAGPARQAVLPVTAGGMLAARVAAEIRPVAAEANDQERRRSALSTGSVQRLDPRRQLDRSPEQSPGARGMAEGDQRR